MLTRKSDSPNARRERLNLLRRPVRLIAAGSVLAGTCLLGLAASAQTTPSASDPLTPPPGNALFLKTTGVGTQDYICLPSTTVAGTTAWTFIRPQAVLSIPAIGRYTLEVAEHALLAVPGQASAADPGCTESGGGTQQYCPSWRSPYDQSTVWGTKLASVTAGSASNCPNTGAIACLLLKSVTTVQGEFPTGLFGKTTYIQRLNTVGGSPPKTVCTTGQIEQVPYSAGYLFYSASP